MLKIVIFIYLVLLQNIHPAVLFYYYYYHIMEYVKFKLFFNNVIILMEYNSIIIIYVFMGFKIYLLLYPIMDYIFFVYFC
jgi:hypothetical protein